MEHLPALVTSLRKQVDKDFEWVVADGASTDGTIEYLRSIDDLNIKVISEEDFGIYDALNRGIKASSGEFYLVVGADDILYSNAIQEYKINLNDRVDLLTASFKYGNKVITSRGGPVWFYSALTFFSGHSVGSVYRKSLHKEFGYYSSKFPIAADQLFMLSACLAGKEVLKLDTIIGEFNDEGLSSVDVVGALTEIYRLMLSLGFNKYGQTFLLIFRIVKNISKIK